jgi:hypothetical protein
VRGHPQTKGEELLKDHCLIMVGLQNSLLPWLVAHAIGKIAAVNHPTGSADSHGPRPKEKPPRAIHHVTSFTV